VNDHFSADLKQAMLENAVSQVPELRAIKTQADHAKTQSGKHLTYLQYCSLLSSAAQQYDDQFTQSNLKTKTRRVYQHDTSGYEPSFDIDLDVSDLIKAHATNFIRGPRLQKQQWDRLATSSQGTWDTIPNEDKSIILETRKPRERGPRPGVSANLHDISAYDYLEAYNHGLGNRPEQASDAPEPPEHPGNDTIASDQTSSRQTDGSGDQLLAHMTKRTPLHPGNIQRVLSTTMSKSSGGKHDEIIVNGKQYRSVNTAKIIYSTASHRQRTRRGALVDRGANGGIAGDDVRVVDRTSRQVDVQGIDNHQIVDIPIATVGAVVKTQRGDVIAIMHQYAYTGKGKTIHSSGQLEWFKQDVNDRSIKVRGGLHYASFDE
jgi:hypothetical protein